VPFLACEFCDTNNQQVYQAEAYWYVPTVSAPPKSEADCTSTGQYLCDFAAWVGLTDSTSPSSGTIVQAGTYATYWGIRSPAAEYIAWTEIYCSSGCQSMLQCPSGDNVAAGDSMDADIENQLAYNGTPGNNYYIFLVNWTRAGFALPAHNLNRFRSLRITVHSLQKE
jgi:Peptidase A4 family